MSKPLAIDLCCGLGGWTEGLLAEGYRVIGYDIEAHEYGDEKYPGELRLESVLTLNGAQFKHAALIVASPPCTEFSYMAMPWKRAKQIARALRGQDVFPDGYKGSRTLAELTAIFDACVRIADEASAAAGHRIPLVLENVKGAQPWVGQAKWSFGSYYLWGDVPALMPQTIKAQKFNPDGSQHGSGSWFAIADSKNRGAKNTGGSWFNVAHNTTSGVGNNPDGRKVPSLDGGRRTDPGKGARFTSRDCGVEGKKLGGDWFNGYAPGVQGPRNHGSGSKARKAASARIAKIPFALSSWIARTYKPLERVA